MTINVKTTSQDFKKDLENAIKRSILSKPETLMKVTSPFMQERFVQAATNIKNQLVDSLCANIEQNFPNSFIKSGDITKKSLQKALKLNVLKGEIQLDSKALEISESYFKKNKDFTEDDLMTEGEWLNDYVGDLSGLTDQDLESAFTSETEEEEEIKMIEYIENKIKDKNSLLLSLKNNKNLQKFNMIWV